MKLLSIQKYFNKESCSRHVNTSRQPLKPLQFGEMWVYFLIKAFSQLWFFFQEQVIFSSLSMTGWNIHFQVNGSVWALRDTSLPPASRQKHKYAGLLLQATEPLTSKVLAVKDRGRVQERGKRSRRRLPGACVLALSPTPLWEVRAKPGLLPTPRHPPRCSESAHQPWGEAQLPLSLIYFKIRSLGTDAISRALLLMSCPLWADITSLLATIPSFAPELGFHPDPLLTAQVMWWGRQRDLGTLEILSCTCWGEQECSRNVSVQQKVTPCDFQ